MVVGRPPRGAHLPLPPGRGRQVGSSCRGGVRNGDSWWPGEGLEVAGLCSARAAASCCCVAGAEEEGWAVSGDGAEEGEDGGVGLVVG